MFLGVLPILTLPAQAGQSNVEGKSIGLPRKHALMSTTGLRVFIQLLYVERTNRFVTINLCRRALRRIACADSIPAREGRQRVDALAVRAGNFAHSDPARRQRANPACQPIYSGRASCPVL